ncbi:LuxR C-terminal-related transcriptional regulator [Streptomyces xanthochromogenes]|uniref:LuxR C-terminal-related transcriptional regulator n=1 Tax=Streptomyces xanthochromogenes TaxID=67384 RepID=UPI00343A80CA
MSREVHDTVAQGFTSVLMPVRAVRSELAHDVPLARRHLDLKEATARQNLAEARALVAGGAPADLDGGSLPDAVCRLAARHEPPASLEVSGSARELPAGLEVVTLRAVEAGAAGHLLRDLARGDLAQAVRAAARGETVLAPSVAGRLVDQLRARPERPRLSEREASVLRLVAQGCTNAEIGRRLFVAESTVETHVVRIFGKLGVDDRTTAVTRAMSLGLIQRRSLPGTSRGRRGLRPPTGR